VGKAFIALTSDRSLPVFVEVLNQSNPGERNNVLRQVVQHPSLEKVVALEKVFQRDDSSTIPIADRGIGCDNTGVGSARLHYGRCKE
jgi:hypothetical protein